MLILFILLEINQKMQMHMTVSPASGYEAYLELDVELVVWDRVPMPVELGIWRADQLS